MKKQLLLAILMSISSLVSLMGQSDKKSLNYQAVILDPKAIDIPGAGISGQPLSKGKVCLKFTFLNALGNVDYEETQQTTTDEYGLISLSVGTGSYSNGTYKNFESIIWDANVKSMKVAVSYDGCATFKQVSTQALNYTAYALYAEAVDYKNVRDSPTKLSQFSNDIGYLVPKDLDPIKADIKTNTADIKSNTSQIALANQTIADNKKSSDQSFLLTNQSISNLDTKVAENTTAIKSNTSQIALANQTIADNKKSSDQSFLLTNQSISNLDTKVAENTTAIKENSGSISIINSTLTDQQNQISDNRNQISATNNNLNSQIGGLQGQINTTNSTVSNLTGVAEVVSNKSTLVNLGGANPSDQLYPSQKAAKSYIDNAINDAVGSGVPDATTLAPGKVQLSGDLAGTATNPTVPALANKANLASPAFTGTPTAPTQTTGDNSTKLATTAFVASSLAASSGGVPYSGATGAVNLGAYDLTVNGIKVGLGAGNVSTNTAIGNAALTSNTTGDSNIAVGMNALSTNITGSYSTAIGLDALKLSTGGFNTAFGAFALDKTTTGVNNTAIGPLALEYNETGTLNTAIGYDAGVSSSYKDLTNTTAIGNGARVTASNTIQLGNASVTDVITRGNLTVNFINVGKGGGNVGTNVAFGTIALTSNTTGGSNTAIGHRTLTSNLKGGDNTAIGTNALRFNTGDFSLLKGSYNTATGSSSLNSNTEGSYNTATGANALSLNTLGNRNTAIGYNALEKNTNSYNTAIGSGALRNNTSGDNNTATGYDALTGNTTGVNNTAYGSSTLLSNSTGSGNTAFGYGALLSNLTDGSSKGDNNSAIGNGALRFNTTGSNNTASGNSALINNTTGSYNAAIGNDAGSYIANGSTDNTTSDYSVYLGSNTKASANNAQNEVVIGYNAIGAGSNTIQLGNTAVTTIGGQVAWTAASDSRIKKNIVNSNYGLATVLKLRPVAYNLISNDLRQVGFIAQEVQKLVPEVVTGKEGDLSKGEILGITYSNLVPVLTKAIQEQQKQIKDQNAKIAAQQKQIEELIKLVKGR